MVINRVIYIYINKYLNNTKNNSNAVHKSFCAVISGIITYTIYRKFTIKIIILDCIHRPCIFQVEISHNVSETGSVSVLR
jgi:hypothetical protein